MIRIGNVGRTVAVVLGAIGAVAPCTLAGPMPKVACEAVAAEHARLVASGVPELVKKGPVAVAGSPDAARIRDVARYIELEEQLLFRCGHDKLRATASVTDDETADAPAVAEPPLPRRNPKAASSPPRPAAALKGSQAPALPQPHPRPARKARPKVDDAYRPPPKPAPVQ